jgi:hypothetical protein
MHALIFSNCTTSDIQTTLVARFSPIDDQLRTSFRDPGIDGSDPV